MIVVPMFRDEAERIFWMEKVEESRIKQNM